MKTEDKKQIQDNNFLKETTTDKISSEQNNSLTTHHTETLIISCRIAQQKGAYTLEEARTIMNAIDSLNSNK